MSDSSLIDCSSSGGVFSAFLFSSSFLEPELRLLIHFFARASPANCSMVLPDTTDLSSFSIADFFAYLSFSLIFDLHGQLLFFRIHRWIFWNGPSLEHATHF